MARGTNFSNISSADGIALEGVAGGLMNALESGIDFPSRGLPNPSRVYSLQAAEAHIGSASHSLEISGIDFSHARFLRLGDDLLIVDGDSSVVIAFYFTEQPPILLSAGGGIYPASLIASFLQPFPQDNASADSSSGEISSGERYALGYLLRMFDGDNEVLGSIGIVESVDGVVQVTRDGLVMLLAMGDTIFLNDIISTGSDAEIFLRFTDGMEFRLGSDGRLAIDDFVYDEMSSDGTQVLSIISGAFSYASGLIAGKDPSSVELQTPYGTIGIRGTKILGKVEPVDSSGIGGLTVTILEGRVALLQDSAEVADISGLFETLSVRSDVANGYSYATSTLSVAEILSSYDFLDGSVEQLNEIGGSSIEAATSSPANEDFADASAVDSSIVDASIVDTSPAESSVSAFTDEDSNDDSSASTSTADSSEEENVVVEDGLYGDDGNNELTGSADIDRIYGLGGRDSLFGLGGADELYGGADNDLLYGGAGDDLLEGGAGADEYYFMVGDGSDTIREVYENKSNSIVVNEVHFRSSTSGSYAVDDFSTSVFSKLGNDLRISLNIGGTTQDVTLSDYFLDTRLFELFFVAGMGENALSISIAVPNFIDGTSGGDTLTGTAGVDLIRGLDGDDVLEGSAGIDILDGGAGEDTVSYASASGRISANLADSSGNAFAATGDSYISIENLRGSRDGANILTGDGDNNKLTGGKKEDELHGGAGDDELRGGGSVDKLYGGAGGDILDGGAGIDEYHFSVGDGSDRIIDSDGGELSFSSGASGIYSASDFSTSIFSKAGQDLVISLTVGGVAQKITIVDYFSNSGTFTLRYNVTDGGAYTAVAIPNFIAGTDNPETLTGTAGVDLIRGLGGDDVLEGGAGNDVLDGGAGIDEYHFSVGDGNDEITDADGGKLFFDSSGSGNYASKNFPSASIFTREGQDIVISLTVDGVAQSVTIVDYFSNSGVFTLSYNRVAGASYTSLSVPTNIIIGTSGNDNLRTGTAEFDIIRGLAGDDVLEGGAGADRYYFNVGDGNDRIIDSDGGELHFESTSGSGNYDYRSFSQNIFSKNGQDLVISLLVGGVAQKITIVDYFSNSGNFQLYYNTSYGSLNTYDNASGIPQNFIDGTSGGDTLTGTAGGDVIEGLAGNDVLQGGGGNDVLRGGAGVDELYGGDGEDILDGGAGVDELYGGDGEDTLIYRTGDILDGGAGEDTASFEHYTTFAIVNIDRTDFTSIENVRGATNHENLLTGDGNNNKLYGGEMDDRLEGRAGSDRLDGGAGEDTAEYVAASADVTANLADVSLNTGDAAGDRYYSIENLRGAIGFSNTLTGDADNNVLTGGDKVDSLYGGAGNDRLTGGNEADLLYGGAGMDIYHFERGDGVDTITDTDGGKVLFVSSTAGSYGSGSFVAGVFVKSGKDLVITPKSTGDSGIVTIVNYYDDPSRFSIYYSSGDTEYLVATSVIPT